MTGPGAFLLNYGLFTDATRTTNWGETVGTDTVSGTGTGATQIVTVYGRIPATQNVGIGGYVDTITATVTF
jgi:spore coat protein U-like protein